jgi:bifunctional DNase/RNase
MFVRMELARIIISEINDQQVVFLHETNPPVGQLARTLPILIGIFEATSIDRRVQGIAPQRPLTHDLLKAAIEGLGGRVEEIAITRLKDHVYYSVVRVRQGDRLIELDSRPSDAIALAVHFDPHVPILVAEEVLEASQGG